MHTLPFSLSHSILRSFFVLSLSLSFFSRRRDTGARARPRCKNAHCYANVGECTHAPVFLLDQKKRVGIKGETERRENRCYIYLGCRRSWLRCVRLSSTRVHGRNQLSFSMTLEFDENRCFLLRRTRRIRLLSCLLIFLNISILLYSYFHAEQSTLSNWHFI